MFIRFVDRKVAFSTKNSSIFFAEKKGPPLLTDIAKRDLFERWMDQRKAFVFAGELVCVVDAVVTTVTKRSFICGAEYKGFFFFADVALDLHSLSGTLLLSFWANLLTDKVKKYCRKRQGVMGN